MYFIVQSRRGKLLIISYILLVFLFISIVLFNYKLDRDTAVVVPVDSSIIERVEKPIRFGMYKLDRYYFRTYIRGYDCLVQVPEECYDNYDVGDFFGVIVTYTKRRVYNLEFYE